MGAGAVGINLEDGAGSPDLLCAKIEAVRTAAGRSGVALFVNARCDVYLRALASGSAAANESLARGRRYRGAGADGLFLPGLADGAAIREIVAALDALDGMPLNLLVVPGLPSLSELAALGVRRVSAGSAVVLGAYGRARRGVERFLREGRYDGMLERAIGYAEMNALFERP